MQHLWRTRSDRKQAFCIAWCREPRQRVGSTPLREITRGSVTFQDGAPAGLALQAARRILPRLEKHEAAGPCVAAISMLRLQSAQAPRGRPGSGRGSVRATISTNTRRGDCSAMPARDCANSPTGNSHARKSPQKAGFFVRQEPAAGAIAVFQRPIRECRALPCRPMDNIRPRRPSAS